jgi:DNA-directed RNA polymerase subunit RPC12/RpoP
MKGHSLENNRRGSGLKLNIESYRCGRCGGLMKTEPVFDLVENEIEFMAARCIQCGDIVDPVILMNRSEKGVLSSSTGRARH